MGLFRRAIKDVEHGKQIYTIAGMFQTLLQSNCGFPVRALTFPESVVDIDIQVSMKFVYQLYSVDFVV